MVSAPSWFVHETTVVSLGKGESSVSLLGPARYCSTKSVTEDCWERGIWRTSDWITLDEILFADATD